MFDIDKALRDIKLESRQPSERLRESTRQIVDQEVRNKQDAKRPGRLSWVLPAAAAMLAVFIFLFTLAPAADEVSFITIDINPSISMQVNAAGAVLSVSAENDDAAVLLKSVTLTGLQFEVALRTVVQAADAQGYLKDDGHVLVACFGDAPGVTQQQVEKSVAESTHRVVKVLLLQSKKEIFEEAKALRQKPGVELLKEQASEQGIKEQDVDEIIDKMYKKASGNKSEEGNNQGEKDESRPTPTPKNQSQNNNGIGNHEKKQDKQSDKDESGGKVNKNSSDTSASQDKPKGGNSGNGSSGNSYKGDDKNKENNGGQNSQTSDYNRNKK